MASGIFEECARSFVAHGLGATQASYSGHSVAPMAVAEAMQSSPRDALRRRPRDLYDLLLFLLWAHRRIQRDLGMIGAATKPEVALSRPQAVLRGGSGLSRQP